jgi:xylan 1,4-beta-xylosidase
MKLKYIGFLILLLFVNVPIVKAQRLVLPGDHPDPSVIKVGNTYWASSTTSNWFPSFPLMTSTDLVHWKQHGYIFNKKPDWADFYFWAPELSYDNGKVYVYYAAHRKNGNLSVGAAVANKPEGPYTDLGPLVSQPDGSIDAFAMRDEHGLLFLIWKEDANSVNKPTSIWAQRMKEDRTGLIGEKKELFRNDVNWEGNLVEGVSLIKHNGYFYAIYAAAGCCGINCTYAVGVARSKNLLGPWEKYNQNPIMKGNDVWVCPGHGTPIERNGHYYLLHHAYEKSTAPFTGRQGILSEFRFTKDNWIEFIKEPLSAKANAGHSFIDDFTTATLQQQWQWSIFQNMKYSIKNHQLQLNALPGGSYIGQNIFSGNYEATVQLITHTSTAMGGLGVIGDDQNYIAIASTSDSVFLLQVREGKIVRTEGRHIKSTGKITLKVSVRESKNLVFYYSADSKPFKLLNTKAVDAGFLPPWDRAVRVGLISIGDAANYSSFRHFVFNSH